MGRWAALALVLASSSALADERELQVGVLAETVLLRQNQATHVGWGAGVLVPYGLRDSLAVITSFSCANVAGVQADTTGDAASTGSTWHVYEDALRCSLAPMLQLRPSARLWARAVGGKVTPSIAVGAGYALELRRNRTLAEGNVIAEQLANTSRHGPLLTAMLGVDVRPFRQLSLGITARAARHFHRVEAPWEASVGILASTFFYP